MGLFDRLLKKNDQGSVNVFKGDLASFGEGTAEPAKSTGNDAPRLSGAADHTADRDSSDIEVYITFMHNNKKCWICPECGTISKNDLSNCVVCGWKK